MASAAFQTQLASISASQPASVRATNTVYDAQALQTLLAELAQAATQAELDDQRLQALTDMAPAPYLSTTQQIINAFNDFEFELAAEHIARLQTQLQHGAP